MGEGTQRVATERVKTADERLQKDIEYAEKSQTHLWIAAVVHRVSQQAAEEIALRPETYEPRLDMETLSSVEFGCFICEQPLLRTNVKKRCTGDPH